MIAAIAHMGGHDGRNDRVKPLCFLALTGSAATDVAKDVGIKIGSEVAERAIENISREAIVAINQKVGFRLLTKFGVEGAVNLGKMIPIVGGGVGAVIDGGSTRAVGKISKMIFLPSGG